ncbi:MAG: shikimate kinase [Clostridiales bacterium]|nr:shikimate kinase [Clostridiales bacterium]
MRDNIILTGMPGVGKSTVGVILAKELGYSFLDSDLLIQEREGMLLREIIDKVGAEGFIEVENRTNASINVNRTVIATGGSAVYGREAMEHFHRSGTIVYLKTSFEVIEKRLSDIKGRGVVLKPGQNLVGIYEERVPLYEQYADITVDVTTLDIEHTVQFLLEKFAFLNSNN